MDGFRRINEIGSLLFKLSFNGMGEGKEAFGVMRNGNIAPGVKVRSRRHYKMFCKLDRELGRLANIYESRLDTEVTIRCELCGGEMGNSDGTDRMHPYCRIRVTDLAKEIRQKAD